MEGNNDTSNVLQGLVCLVETLTDDGLNASQGTKQVLEELGASISPQLSETVTHFVTSNANLRRVIAAELMGVMVVSPLWVEQCREAQQRVPESDFNYLSMAQRENMNRWLQSLPVSQSTGSSGHTAPVEPMPRRASLDRSIDSPFFSSSQRPFSAVQQGDDDVTGGAADSVAATDSVVSGARTDKQIDGAGIPLPSYREYVMPKVNASALKRRRSERISDLIEDDDDDVFANEFERYVRKTSSKGPTNKQEELSAVLNIPAENQLPVVVIEGRERDTLPPPLSLQQQREQDKMVHGQDLALRQQKLKKHLQQPQPQLQINSATVGSSSSSNSMSKGAGAVPLITSVPLNVSVASAAFATDQDSVHSGQSSKKQRVAFDGPATLAVPRGGVAIVMTGFDNKLGDKSTLTMMLRQLVKHIERQPSAEGTDDADGATSSAVVRTAGVAPMTRGRGRPHAQKSPPAVVPVGAAAPLLMSTDANAAGFIAPKEKSVSLLESAEDLTAASCTHVIVSKGSTARTLRVLFAIARGLCITTDEWVYDSVSKEAWSDPRLFPHPRFKSNFERANAIFSASTTVYIMESRNPPIDTLRELLVAAGATVVPTVDDVELSYIVFGDAKDANENISRKLRRKKILCVEELHKCRILAEKRQVVTSKFLFNCIEECAERKPKVAASAGEVITVADLTRGNSFDKFTQAAAKSHSKSKPDTKATNPLAGQLSSPPPSRGSTASRRVKAKRGPGRPRKNPLADEMISPLNSQLSNTEAAFAAVAAASDKGSAQSNGHRSKSPKIAATTEDMGDGTGESGADDTLSFSSEAKAKGKPGRKKKQPLTDAEVAALLELRQQQERERRERLAAARATPSERDLRRAKRQQMEVDNLVVGEQLPRKLHGNCKLDGKRVGRKGSGSSQGTPFTNDEASQQQQQDLSQQQSPDITVAASVDERLNCLTAAELAPPRDNAGAGDALGSVFPWINTPEACDRMPFNRPSISGRRSSGVATIIDEPIDEVGGGHSGDSQSIDEHPAASGRPQSTDRELRSSTIAEVRTSNTQVAINSLLQLSNGKEDSRQPNHNGNTTAMDCSPDIQDVDGGSGAGPTVVAGDQQLDSVSSKVSKKGTCENEPDVVQKQTDATTAGRGRKRKVRVFKDPYADSDVADPSATRRNQQHAAQQSDVNVSSVGARDNTPLSHVKDFNNEMMEILHGHCSSKEQTPGLNSRDTGARTSLSSVEAAMVDEILVDSDDDSARESSRVQPQNRRAKMRRSGAKSAGSTALKLVNSNRIGSSAAALSRDSSSRGARKDAGLLTKKGRSLDMSRKEMDSDDDDIQFSQ